MKIAMKNGRIILAEIEQAHRTYSAPVSLDLLNTLAGIFRLPDFVEKERRKLDYMARRLEGERNAAKPLPLVHYVDVPDEPAPF